MSDIERLVTFDRAGVGHLSRALIHDQTRRCIEAQLVLVAQRSHRSRLPSKAALGMSQGERRTSDPHLGQTNACRRFLEATGDLAERVVKILDLMDELHVNLPIFLWAISWNEENLVSNARARFARTALMLSDELPVILTNWHQPPRQHNAGIRTKAAKLAMTNWALETLCSSVDDELVDVCPIMHFPQDDLSEEALLGISVQDMISEVQTRAPILWKLVCHLTCTHTQVRRNKTKNNPEPVAIITFAALCFHPLTTS